MVFSTQNVYLYDLRYPHFAVSEFPLNINFKGLEIKEIEIYGNESYLNTHKYFSGVDITYKDNSHLLFDCHINNQTIFKNEKNEQDKDSITPYHESNNYNEDYNQLRKESFSNENESSSNIYEKNFSFSKNKIKNNDKISTRKRTGSAIDIDDESSFISSVNKNDNKNYSSDNESNIRTEKRNNKINFSNNKKLDQINENHEESSYKEDESEKTNFNKDLMKNRNKIENSESESNENNSYANLNLNKDKNNQNFDNLNNAFKKSLNLNVNEKYYESFFENEKEELLNSEFFVDFLDVKLINSSRDVHDNAGFLFIKGHSIIKDIDNFNNYSEFNFKETSQNNEIFEKIFLKKGLKEKNKSKFYFNFTMDHFGGIKCNINKIINSNDYSQLDKNNEDFIKIKKLFIDNIKNKENNDDENDLKNNNDIKTDSGQDPLINLLNMYKKFYISNFINSQDSKNRDQQQTIEKNKESDKIEKYEDNLLVKYDTKNLNRIKTKCISILNSNKKTEEKIKEISNQKNNLNSNDIIMKSDEESVAEISDSSFNELVNIKEKANSSAEGIEDLVSENKEDNEIIDFGKARVNGKLLKMFDIQNKRKLLENILLKNNKTNKEDDFSNKTLKNLDKEENDMVSETSSLICSNEKTSNAKNQIKHSYNSDNFLNFQNKLNLNNISGNINTPKSTVSSLFGFDRKNSDHTMGKQPSSKAVSNKNCSFNLNLNLNYNEKKMNKKKSETNHQYINNSLSERNIYYNINEDDEYSVDEIYNGDLERNSSDNALGHNHHNADDNNLSGSQNDVLKLLFDRLKNEK